MREHIRLDGKKSDEYFGPAKSVSAREVERLAHEIGLAKALAAGSSQLRLLAYQRIDRKPAAVLGACYNRSLFRAGLVLVGSHAYGALLNELGILSTGYKTLNIGLVRGERPDVVMPKGASLVEVEELGAHAQTIAHLDFLVEEPIEAVCLSPNQVVPVLVPAPERFAVHKLFSSQSRGAADRGKSGKDLAQAAVLAAALERLARR